jgi:hypothetical protein
VAPYRIVEVGKDYVIVDQMKNGGISKLFFSGNAFYVEVKVASSHIGIILPGCER